MKTKKKAILIVGGLLVALAIVGFSVTQTQKSLVTVQTGKVIKQDIASYVTASGEVKPEVQVNVGANAFGRITKLFGKDGDRVHKGQMLVQLENIQSSSDVAGAKAALEASVTDQIAAQAALKTAQEVLKSSSADYLQKKQDYERNSNLYKEGLISTADYETKKAAFEVATATQSQDQSRVNQAKAQLDSSQGHVAQARAILTHSSDVLSKTIYEAPFDG